MGPSLPLQQKWYEDFIVTIPTRKDISIMIWGAIDAGGRSDVVMMKRDEDAPRRGYSARSYLEVLEEQIPRTWQPGMTFQ